MLLHLPPAASTSVILYLCLTWQQLGCTKALTFFEDLDCVSLTFSFFFFRTSGSFSLLYCHHPGERTGNTELQKYETSQPSTRPPRLLTYEIQTVILATKVHISMNIPFTRISTPLLLQEPSNNGLHLPDFRPLLCWSTPRPHTFPASCFHS